MFPAVQERIPPQTAYFNGPEPVPDDPNSSPSRSYRGRIAPTPSGWLHLGHAATFRIAWERARQAGGRLVYRTEDIDPARYRPEYAAGAMEDLRWWGLDWDEGPDCGGSYAPYTQAERLDLFHQAFERLRLSGHIYPSRHSRKTITESHPVRSPADGDPLFPPNLRPALPARGFHPAQVAVNWRFRVPDGRAVSFNDGRCGWQSLVAGEDFGDFLVWKKNGWPAYELAVVVDDHTMDITEVVRGEDLLVSTARQLLLYEALGWEPPQWYHCPLVADPKTGHRMSKTSRSLGLRTLRERGYPPGLPPSAYFTFDDKIPPPIDA